MTTTLDVDPTHASQALQQAGYAEGERVRLTIERVQPRRTLQEIAERAHREGLMDGLSDEILLRVREFRETLTLDPNRRNKGDTE